MSRENQVLHQSLYVPVLLAAPLPLPCHQPLSVSAVAHSWAK